MSSKFGWSRWVCFAVILAAAVIWHGTKTGRSQVRPPSEPAPFDLTGRWKSDTGETVVIRHDSAGQVTARFSPIVPCWDQTRSDLFSAPLVLAGSGDEASYKLASDNYTACTNTKKMIDDCRVQKVFQTKFRADVSADGNTISGASFRPGYAFEVNNGRYVNCRRSAEYDGWQDFVLTRETEPTPTPTPTPGTPPTTYPTPTPTPTPSAFCQGVPSKTANADREIDRMLAKLEKSIVKAEEMAATFEARSGGGADKAVSRSAEFYRTKAAELRKLKEYWTKIRLAPCIPTEIVELLKAVLDGNTNLCPRLCDRTADWIAKMTPGPQGEMQKNEFLTLCSRYCAS